MPDITKIKIGNERERSYKDFPANREFKKRAEDDNPGGGWPSDLPKPSVGGFGYTEQGNQTTITWDGDTDGKVDIMGQSYKISELTPTIEEVIGGVVYTKSQDDGIFPEEITVDSITTISEHSYRIQGFGQSFVVVALEDEEIEGVTFERGMYYSKKGSGTYSRYISSLTYGTPDTVHKIDEKYLPEGGGAMVVTFTITEDGTVATHTVEQVSSAMKSGIVYAVLQQIRDGETVFVCSGVMECLLYDDSDDPVDDGSPCLVCKSVSDNEGSPVVEEFLIVSVSNGEWAAGL